MSLKTKIHIFQYIHTPIRWLRWRWFRYQFWLPLNPPYYSKIKDIMKLAKEFVIANLVIKAEKYLDLKRMLMIISHQLFNITFEYIQFQILNLPHYLKYIWIGKTHFALIFWNWTVSKDGISRFTTVPLKRLSAK